MVVWIYVLKTYLILLLSSVFVSHLFGDAFYYSNGKKIDLSPVDAASSSKQSSSRVSSTVKYYKTPSNNIVGVSNQLIIKFENLDNFEEIVHAYKLVLLKKIYKNSYLFKVERSSDALDIANQIYKLPSVEFTHPNFIRKAEER